MSRLGRQSKVLTARLYYDNPDEARALSIVENLERAGLNRSDIIKRAILCLGEHAPPDTPNALAETLKEMIGELQTLMNKSERGVSIQNEQPSPTNQSVKVNPKLTAALMAQRLKVK